MTPKKKPALKVHRNFKVDPRVDKALRIEAAKTRRTQTVIIEMALEEFLGLREREAKV